MKKILFILSFISFVMLSKSTYASDTGTCGNNCHWALDDDGTLTVSGTGTMYDYSWDQTPWFEKNKNITNIVIENGITSVGLNAFYQTNAETVSLPNSLKYIAPSAFQATKITDIVIPNSVEVVGYHALSELSLKSLTISDKTIFPIEDYSDYELKLFDYSDLSELKIYCTGDIQKCNDNLKNGGYENLKSNFKAKRRIYTLDEANRVAGKKNRVSIKYR